MNLIKTLIAKQFTTSYLLCLSVLSSFLLLAIRIQMTHNLFYGFLVWNLCLAIIPYAISTYAINKSKLKKWQLVICFVFWLAFLPNAPYIVTDFVHLKPRQTMPFWFDILLMFSAALNGLFLAFISLYDVEKKVREDFSNTSSNLFVVLALFLGSLGIYLGRFLRYNSWDFIGKPFRIYDDAVHIFLSPIENINVFGFMFLFTCFLSLAYFFFRNIANVSFLSR